MNKSNGTISEASCELNDGIAIYGLPIISIFGIITNSLTSMVFIKIIRKRRLTKIAPMYYFLTGKSIMELIMFWLQILSPIYFTDRTSKSIIPQIWYIYGFNYLTDVLLVCSALLEIAASIDIRFSSSKSSKQAKPIVVILFIILFLTFASIFSLVNVFRYQIELVVVTTNETNSSTTTNSYYMTSYTDFQKLTLDKYIRFAQSIFREDMILLVIVCINTLIVISVRRSINNKGRMYGTQQRKLSQVKHILNRGEKAKTKAKIMVIVIGINYTLGHVPLSIYYLPFVPKTHFWSCFYVISWIPFYLSYTLSLFVYFKFNTFFRSTLISYFKRFYKPTSSSGNNNHQHISQHPS